MIGLSLSLTPGNPIFAGGVATTVNNLSGDMNNATNWYTPDSTYVTLTRLTQAQFLAAQPEATIPPGHIDANGILKVSVAYTGAGTMTVRRRNFSGINFADKKNLVLRGYMPPAQSARWDAAAVENCTIWYMTGAVGSYANYYRSRGLTYTPSGANIGVDKGHWHYACVPNAWSSTDAFTHNLSNLHPTAAVAKIGSPTTLDWLEISFKTDGVASPALDMYLFDIVEFVEEKPALYLTWDDGNDEHRQVCTHLRAGTKFGGGSLGSTFPTTFCVPESLVDAANRLTTQNMRDMRAEGASFMVHGDGAPSTWSTVAASVMAGEITAFQALVAAEGWPAIYGRGIAYIGNDFYSNTTDAQLIKDVAAANGITFARGMNAFSKAYPLDMIADPLKGGSGVLLGQSATSVRTAADAEKTMAFMNTCKMSVIVNAHGVVPSAPGSIDLLETEFDDVFGAFGAELALGASSRIRVADIVADLQAAGIAT